MGRRERGGIPPSFTRLAAGCARAPPPSAQLRGETVLGRKWGEGGGWRRGTNPPLFKVSLGWWRREEERGAFVRSGGSSWIYRVRGGGGGEMREGKRTCRKDRCVTGSGSVAADEKPLELF